MCNPPAPVKKALSIAAVVANPTMALGSASAFGAGKGAKEGYDKGGVVGSVTGAVGGSIKEPSQVIDTITGRTPPSPPPIPSADAGGGSGGGGGDPGPAPVPTASNPTDLAAMLNKKRLAVLRMGLLSTMTNGGRGDTSAPSLFAPTAFAAGTTGTKTALGQ